MASLPTRLGKNIKRYNMETGTYEFRNVEGLLEGTQLTCKKCKQSPFKAKGYPQYADSEMQQALVVIMLEFRKTPRLSLGRFSEQVFLRIGDSTLTSRAFT